MKNKIKFSKDCFSLIFQNVETIKDKSLCTKTSFKNLLKTLKKMEKIALEILSNTGQENPNL